MPVKKRKQYDEEDFFKDLEDEEVLEESEESAQEKYDIAQRELLTQSVDFNIKHLADMAISDQIDTNPKYQRRLRWDTPRKSRLVESLLMNVPIPPIFLSEESYGKYSVIDGKQRLNTLSELFRNVFAFEKLEVFYELNGKTFAEIPSELQNILNSRPTIRCIIIQKQSHPEIKFAVFERLNTGGVKLNDQEIRNSAYRGEINNRILELSENPKFRHMLRVQDPERSQIVQYMRDCELVLRFFALKDSWNTFTGSLKTTLNSFMYEHKNTKKEVVGKFEKEFLETLDSVNEIFGEFSFRRWDNKKNSWSRLVLASIYDAQMLAVYKTKVSPNKINSKKVIENFKKLFLDDVFVSSVVNQTNTPSRLKYRVSALKTILETKGN